MSDSFKRIERPASGAAEDPAPAYDDINIVHLYGPSNGPSHSSSSGYTSVPQTDIEHHASVPIHTHNSLPPPLEQPQETLAQTIAGVFRPKPHLHCEECDRQAERRERLANKRHCCAMVALVFIMLFFCSMVLGIVIANAAARKARAHHD
ncbi:hypothetical protein GRF29_28g877901 [Pseudopithomyces chartarum]|uniref:LITAF domain-containing protein n=1 Tax=Pseudopithomyces chartarum TaxID=1892770 RepID=A0AAN6LZP3_9PLEO|nr:hypothetical protein GRF29_28g877901 [Pseudopithomyces chartarum]